jgi:hypothetical protein
MEKHTREAIYRYISSGVYICRLKANVFDLNALTGTRGDKGLNVGLWKINAINHEVLLS